MNKLNNKDIKPIKNPRDYDDLEPPYTDEEYELLRTHDTRYICLNCYRDRMQCNCRKHHRNSNIVELDRGMTDIIITLNKKGYKTIYCCESHYKYVDGIYIAFKSDCFNNYANAEYNEYILSLLTDKGFYTENFNGMFMIRYKTKYPHDTKAEFDKRKDYALSVLRVWADFI